MTHFTDPNFLSDVNASMRIRHLFSPNIITDMNMEAIHLLLTFLWIFSGCFFQFFTVCLHIRHQDYLSTSWKFFVVLSSILLLGPTMVYVFCIMLVLSFKMRCPTTPSTESKVRQLLNSTLLFAGRAKLAEIFFESIPQLLTQLAMTSAKGDEGVRALTGLQMASVFTSAITIALGISKYVIDGGSAQ